MTYVAQDLLLGERRDTASTRQAEAVRLGFLKAFRSEPAPSQDVPVSWSGAIADSRVSARAELVSVRCTYLVGRQRRTYPRPYLAWALERS
jgi:hypothetical protein